MILTALAAASILSLSTAHGVGSACPIAPGIALTAAHVVDVKPLDPSFPLIAGHWSAASDPFNVEGEFVPVVRWGERDLALIQGPFVGWFPIAKSRLQAGQTVWALGPDFRHRSEALTWTHKVSGHVVGRAGSLVTIDRNFAPGFSGSCVFNEQNEVVGIVSGSFSTDEQDRPAGTFVVIAGHPVEEFRK